MGIFGSKENKQAETKDQLIENLKFKGMTEKDIETLAKIALDLKQYESFKNGLAHVGKVEDQMQIAYTNVLIEQNWLILNQLTKLNQNIEKLIEK